MPLLLRFNELVGHLADIGLGDPMCWQIEYGISPNWIEGGEDQRVVIIYANLLDPPLLVPIRLSAVRHKSNGLLEDDLGGLYR
jgi:hypothetical protein